VAEAKGVNSGGAKGPGGDTPEGAGAPSGKVQFKNIWPLPALVLGGAMLVGGGVVYLMNQPKPPADIPLEQAKALVEEKRYQEAIDKLNSKDVRNYIDYGAADADHRRAFYLARARAFAGAQQTLGLNRLENHRSIVEDFQRAEKEGAEGTERQLIPADISLITQSLIALDQIDGEDGALRRIEKLPETEQPRKTRLIRSVVEHNLAVVPSLKGDKAAVRSEQTLELLADLSADPALSPADKAWVLARQGEMLISAGRPDEAINKLIRRVGLLKDVPLEQQGELYVLLGKAYFQADQPINAMHQLEAADALLERSSPLRADLGVMLGRLAQSGVAVDGGAGHGASENDPAALLEFAREKFEGVIGEFGNGKQYARAVLGVAEVEAALRHDDKSLEKYAELVELVNSIGEGSSKHEEPKKPAGEEKPENKPDAGHDAGEHGAATAEDPKHGEAKPAEPKPGDEHGGTGVRGGLRLADKIRPRSLGDVTKASVLTSLMQRFQERFDSGQRESALRYADIAETMYKDSEMPPEILLAIGSTRRALGDALMSQVKEQYAADTSKSSAEFSVESLDAATRAEVKKHYIVAGDYLRRHATSVAATDPGASAASLWTAADSYDRAGDMDEAKKAFADYANTAADTDPNKPEAKFRLAQVFQAKREYAAAIELYRDLKDSRDQPDLARNAGVVADRAIVPLAQCMLSDGDATNDEEAERLLQGIVEGGGIGPEAQAYREALIELGESSYRRERFAQAIAWLEGVAKRYKDDRRIESVRYLLADSHRREAVSIARTLSTQRLPQAQKDQLETTRVDHLRSARTLYEGVKAALEKKEPRLRTNLEKIQLRNAYFYLGDCAMEMRDYDAAIAAYDDARKQYSEEPSSLVAMAQIVSAYAAQEKWAEARTANERARLQLAKFPESVWQNPDLPMEKRHWERWLDARTLIGQQGQATGAGGTGGDKGE
jgi:tetratricopeptide (TPR) repeat protein